MRRAIYWQGKGLFGIGQNGFEESIITVEIVQMLKTELSLFALNEHSHQIRLSECLVLNHNKKRQPIYTNAFIV